MDSSVPVASPVQFRNSLPASGTAVAVTSVPLVYSPPVGSSVTDPEPVILTDNAYLAAGVPVSHAPKSGLLPLYGIPTSVPASIKSLPGARCIYVMSGKLPSALRGPNASEELMLKKSAEVTTKGLIQLLVACIAKEPIDP